MIKQAKPGNRTNFKPVASPKAKPRPRSTRQKPKQPLSVLPRNIRLRLFLISLEVLGLLVTGLFAIIVLLGYSAHWFSGIGLFDNLLPFAFGILALVLVATLFLIAWWKLRKWLQGKASIIAPVLSLSFMLMIGWFVMQDQFNPLFEHFRTLVGGKQEASRVTLTHQVYAAYRRYNPAQLHQMVTRSLAYNTVIEEAARVYEIDVNLLQGIAATESSFLPRDSQDGGHGLFQITQVPKAVINQVSKHLSVTNPSLINPRHNAFIAAATLKYYLAEMKNDLFLGLLAYNIGPTNGGLRFIMQQYGVIDFVTIQPYLQQLPRDYPIRVLSYSLAFRLWQKEGKLLAYEEGKNAIHIQRIGIPGLPIGY